MMRTLPGNFPVVGPNWAAWIEIEIRPSNSQPGNYS
jgi:hypothetical protein